MLTKAAKNVHISRTPTAMELALAKAAKNDSSGVVKERIKVFQTVRENFSKQNRKSN